MVTDKGEFKFAHSRDYWDLSVGGKVFFPEGSGQACTTLDDGRTVFLVVSDHEEKGSGLQDQPNPGTVRAFTRHSRAKGVPLPWENTITYDTPAST